MYKIRKIVFHEHPVLKNLSLDFCDSEGKCVDTIILAGENGTGKSTIINSIYMLVSRTADFEADVEFEKNGEVFQMTYDILSEQFDRPQLDELVEIMVEVAMNRSQTIKIGRDAEYHTEYVQDRFRKLDSMHIEKVLDGLKENTTRVYNTKAYLMAALFNVVSTIDNHYAMLVNHDFYGG